jgi:hypothetical protein
MTQRKSTKGHIEDITMTKRKSTKGHIEDITMTKRKSTKGQIMVDKTLYKKLKIEQKEFH